MTTISFADRTEAANSLTKRLAGYRGKHALVLAIPRGAVPMGRILADALAGELDVVLVRKLGAPGNPELAVGSVDETGHVYLADHAATLGISERYIEQEKQDQLATLRRRRAEYTPVRAPIDPAGRTVIVVDDGIATGTTVRAALQALRRRAPGRLVLAVPVAPPDTVARLRAEVDEIVCLAQPVPFMAIGPYYDDFHQLADTEVTALMRDLDREQAAAAVPGGT